MPFACLDHRNFLSLKSQAAHWKGGQGKTKKGRGLLFRDNPQPHEVKLAADLRRVESLREWRGSGVLSTSRLLIPANAFLWSLRRNLAALSSTLQC
jgi:hypothetical protein